MKKNTLNIVLVAMLAVLMIVGYSYARRGQGRFGGGQSRLQDAQGRFQGGEPGFGGPQHEGRHGRHPGPGKMMIHVLRQLDLDDEQKEQVRGILENYKEDLRVARQAIGEAMKALHETVADEQGIDAIYAASAQVGTAIGDEAVLRSQMMGEIKALLTQEQLDKLEEIKADMKARMEEMKQRMDERLTEEEEAAEETLY